MTHSGLLLRFSLVLATFFGCAERSWGTTIVDFEDERLPIESAFPASADDQSSFVKHGVAFNRSWNSEYGCCPSGWALSNQTVRVTPGLAGTYSAVVSTDAGGDSPRNQFAIGNNLQRGESRITFPMSTQVQGVQVTNVTYAYLAAVEGDDGAGVGRGFVKGPFQTGDWFRLEVIGLDATGTETGREAIFLVDYRDGNANALDDWTWYDLTSLGNQVATLEFEMSSSDTGEFGMNTPAYFAIDDLTFHSAPEPGGSLLVVLALAIGGKHLRRRCAGNH